MDHEQGAGSETSALEEIAREAGDSNLFSLEVLRLYEQGEAGAARKALLQSAKTEQNRVRKELQVHHANDYRLWLEPIASAPSMTTFNGIGTSLYGRYQAEADGTYIATLWFVLVFIPIWPFASYLVAKAESGGWHFIAKSPLASAAATMRKAVIGGLAAIVALAALGVYWAGTHASIISYNGFDQPVEVQVGETTQTVPARGYLEFDHITAEENTSFNARYPGQDEPFESFEIDLTGHAHDVIVYNVAGRALLSVNYIRYGPGEPPEGRWLEAGSSRRRSTMCFASLQSRNKCPKEARSRIPSSRL